MVGVLENREEKEEEDSGRFVGRMAVSFRGEAEDGNAAITLHSFNHKKHRKHREDGPTDQLGKSLVDVKRNGLRAAAMLHRYVLYFFPFCFCNIKSVPCLCLT